MITENKKIWAAIFAFIAFEQAVKGMIYLFLFKESFPILPPLLYFEPMFNRHYSWLNSMLQLDVSKWVHVIVVAIMSALIYMFYQFLNKQYKINRTVNVMFIFLFSGSMCSLIDKIFWDGSLDYIMLKGFFTFDLKDIYINVFTGLIIFFLLFKNKALKQIDEKQIIKDFAKYILHKK